MSKDLKPCPFCGGKSKIKHEMSNDYWLDVPVTIIHFFVKCKKCGAISKKFKISEKYIAAEKAIEAWNRRANNDN